MAIQDLETLIQRHAAGDRDPELLARLNAAAWDGFHDPWEPRPVEPGAAGPEAPLLKALQLLDEEPAPDPRVARPRRCTPSAALESKLVAYLEVHRIPYRRDVKGCYRCKPSGRGMKGRDLLLHLGPVGNRPDHLSFVMGSSWAVPEEAWAMARIFCAEWSHDGRALRAELDPVRPIPGLPQPQPGTLMLQGRFTLPAELTLKAVVVFLDECMAEAREFWTQARSEAEDWQD